MSLEYKHFFASYLYDSSFRLNNNRYRTYPIGFYKEVKLNEKKANQVIEIIEEIIGLPIEEVETLYPKIELKKTAKIKKYKQEKAMTLYVFYILLKKEFPLFCTFFL